MPIAANSLFLSNLPNEPPFPPLFIAFFARKIGASSRFFVILPELPRPKGWQAYNFSGLFPRKPPFLFVFCCICAKFRIE